MKRLAEISPLIILGLSILAIGVTRVMGVLVYSI